DYHDALFDAMASALILEYILKEFPDIPLENLVNPEMGEYYKRRAKEIALAEPAKNAKEEKL
ncbi:MAG: hypothetical protein KAI81_00960, partial [Candidatus Marinimicrobia bacterium]|nr:hypothetical protein [Candidatus Neomarinimicrobiota bacterium]